MAISFVDSAVSNGATITIPGTASAGHLAVLLDYAKKLSNAIPTDVVPTNWTGLGTFGDSSFIGVGARVRASARILQAGEPGSSITGMDDNTEGKVMFVFASTNGIASFSAFDFSADFATTDPSSQTINASGGNVPLIVFGWCAEGDNAPEFSTASPAFDAEVETASGNSNAGYKIYNSSPADHTIDMGDNGSANIVAGFWLEIEEGGGVKIRRAMHLRRMMADA